MLCDILQHLALELNGGYRTSTKTITFLSHIAKSQQRRYIPSVCGRLKPPSERTRSGGQSCKS